MFGKIPLTGHTPYTNGIKSMSRRCVERVDRGVESVIPGFTGEGWRLEVGEVRDGECELDGERD